jgi:hypothetical protein
LMRVPTSRLGGSLALPVFAPQKNNPENPSRRCPSGPNRESANQTQGDARQARFALGFRNEPFRLEESFG